MGRRTSSDCLQVLTLLRPLYNHHLLTKAQRDRFSIVLVSPRNPLNIGAVARAMANFGFTHLKVVAPYAPHWHEAKSAVGADELLAHAAEKATLAEAVGDCTLVLGTGTLTYRKPEQPVVQLPNLAPFAQRAMESGGNIALVFGPEKHGLTREDLSYCHALIEIPTDAAQPSMNLGQAVAVCLYELATRAVAATETPAAQPRAANSEKLDLVAGLIEKAMLAADYSPASMREANSHDLRLLLRRLSPSETDVRRILCLFRRILCRLEK